MRHAHSLSSPQRPGLLRAEAALLALALTLAALAVLGPPLPGSEHQHHFADQRTLWGIACALDVLSNLPFAALGFWGLWRLRCAGPGAVDAASRAAAGLFFAGLVFTAAGSTLYHLQPDDAGLLWDRLGMVLPFAGLLGLAAAGRASPRAGWAAMATVLLAGPVAVLAWAHTGNLLPWAMVQLGGMLIVLVLAVFPRRAGALAVNLGAVMGLYALAKLFEASDHAVFDATSQVMSGHSLKHLFAAGAAWPVLMAVATLRHTTAAPDVPRTGCGQNGAHIGGVARSVCPGPYPYAAAAAVTADRSKPRRDA